MKCPRCNYEWKLPGPQAGGRARVKKGFASPAVQRKAQATRRRNKAKQFPRPAGIDASDPLIPCRNPAGGGLNKRKETT